MKFLFLCLSLFEFNSTSSFYTIKFTALDGTLLKTSSYQGKKVVVAVVSANNTSISLIRYLDSVQLANSAVQVIAIPTGEFDGSVSRQDLIDLKNSISIVVTKPLKVRKTNAALQHPLFVWLTQAKENRHFDMDVEGERQLYVISAAGTLYSVLSKNTPLTVIGTVINQNFTE